MGWLPAASGVVGTYLVRTVWSSYTHSQTYGHADSGMAMGFFLVGTAVFLPLFAVIATSIAMLMRAIISRRGGLS